MNLWIKTPDLKTLSHMYLAAWHTVLKTTYYLRSLGASNIEKATVSVKKEVRGAVKEGQSGGQNSGDAGGSHSVQAISDQQTAAAAHFDTTAPFTGSSQAPTGSELKADSLPLTASAKRSFTAAEKTACSIEAMRNGGECEACQ